MKLVISATDRQWEELTAGQAGIEWERVTDENGFLLHTDAAAFFNLKNNNFQPALQKPVFINSVTATLKEMHAPANVLRINGWTGFLQRQTWEIAGIVDDHIRSVFDRMGKKIVPVADEPGLAAARIISMIINEAFFTVGDGVCSRNEINIAMKLGTNYPHGPFEWAEAIGPENVLELLLKLAANDNRYKPAPLLAAETQKSDT